MIMDIYDNIVNFLEMENTGALLIVGAWGSGKTYYLDNVVFKKLKEAEKPYHCVRVSLFGVKDTVDIPYRVFQAYTDSEVKDKTSGKIKFDKVRDWSKRLYNTFPKLREYVDLSPLFTKGNAAYSFLPNDIVICFDDIERATETLDINEILGAVNELVENRHYKVILVANKEYIDSKLQAKQQSKSVDEETKQEGTSTESEKELFYEKVVEKTIAYEPDIVVIYRKLVESYKDADFTAFMTNADQQIIIDPNRVKSKKYRKQLQNIRTLKFAIEHFYQIWKMSDKDDVSETGSLSYKKLHNYWLFTHAVAIEQKAEHLKYDDDKGLSLSLNIVERLDFGDEADKDNLFVDEEEKDDTPTVDTEFVKKFKKRHFESFNESFVFYQPIYDFLTASKTFDMKAVEAKANETFNVENGVINPVYEILNTLLTKGFWTYTNAEAPQKLTVLYNAVENGELNDFVSYYNAGFFLFGFKQLVGKTEKELKTAFSKGINLFTKRIPVVNVLTKSQIKILPSDDTTAKWIIQEMLKCIDECIKADNQKAIAELDRLFMSDLAQFSSMFAIAPGKTPAFFQVPILEKLNLQNVKNRIATLEPADVMQLYYFINFRYLMSESRCYVSELPFLNAVSEGIQAIDMEKHLLSNYIIEQHLKPTLDKTILRLDYYKNIEEEK